MTYPGNQSLASDVQQRIRSTFDHTLGLAEKGSRQEALLGCDFVLRMDPLFEPARRLQERLEAATGPLAVDDLRRMDAAPASSTPPSPERPAGPAAGPEAAHDPLWVDLDGLASELPDLPDPQSGALRAEFETLLAERRFQELQLRARSEAAAVTADLELQRLAALAQERLEAGPYVSKFLLSAREALRSGNVAEANRLLDKARTLDPTHPGLAELSTPAASGGGASPGRAGAGPVGAIPVGASVAGAPGAARRELEMQTQPISGLPRAGAMAPGSAAPSLFPPSPGPIPPPLAATPAAPAPQRPAPGPLAATSPATTSPALAQGADTESERRIQQLLDEGQAALDGGDPQAAIDAWSRIFLIDIDHQEAAHRIEMARRMKAERDRQVEETFHDGLAHLEANDLAGARTAFQRVLELQPGHLQSREYLQQLDEGGIPAVSSGGGRAGRGTAADRPTAPAGNALPPLPAGLARAAGAGAVDLAADQDLHEEILVPPDVSQTGGRPPEARREVRAASAASHAGRARRLFLVVGSAVLLLVLAVGWFLYQKREQWFPNSRTEEPAQPPAPNPIPRAVKLHNSGKVAIALAQLSHVPQGDPHYKEAQALIAKWQAEPAEGGSPPGAAPGAPTLPPGTAPGASELAPGAGAPGSAGTASPAGAPGSAAPDAERRQTLIEEGGRAFQQGSYLLAAERYEAADRLGKLNAGDAAQLTAAKQKLVPLQRQIAMFRSHDWDFALPELWRIHESDPGNRDVTRMIVDSYYNLGVRSLLHNDVTKAAQQFGEAKNLAPDDPEIKRQLVFARTYLERGPDLLYRIYVKYLPIR